ncbi:hypothetical protein [Pelomonas cellulosilytica]|uniref:Uncharacterized protein n=1 Tax=Pelomonas cellulosilytica TaxID=2906762 RepID=A0ABS8XZY7_9BURK|nr:hypothetical protein [Pelomonas sp. P8]MCE4558154.1 hypothetical protein [Pelomonas sp. P8]
MNTPARLARLMAFAFHLNLATAAAMVLWTAWTGHLVATGQIRPTPTPPPARTAPAAESAPLHTGLPACNCRPRRDELQVRATTPEGVA